MFFIAAAVAITAIAGASAQDPSPTPAPGYDYAYTQDMPYSWMTEEGYKSVDCGYGYNKDSSQHCTKADWVRRNSPILPSAAHYLHSALLCNSMITRAAMQQRSSSKFRSSLLDRPPHPRPRLRLRPRLRHSHYWVTITLSTKKYNSAIQYMPILERALLLGVFAHGRHRLAGHRIGADIL